MAKLVVGPIDKGFKTNRLPFNIDNDSFPKLINAYQWRGRAKRKRGTSPLGRLQVIYQLGTVLSVQTNGTSTFSVSDVLADPNVNLRSIYPNAQIVPGTVTISTAGTGNIFTDPGSNAILTGGNAAAGSQINYSNGALTINFTSAPPAAQNVTVKFNYYPALPVLGIEDFAQTNNNFPMTEAFDTRNSYSISTFNPYVIQDNNYYMNPASTGGYTQKTAWTPFHWNGQDYQQFWTTNYQGALWVTNGIDTPFTGNKIAMQFANISDITGSGTDVVITIDVNNVLVIGDFVFANEINGMTGINWQTGYVIAVANSTPDGTHAQVTVQFPNASIAGTYGRNSGILQFLTNNSNPNKDVIRYYNGSPTSGAPTTVNFVPGNGWVNFMPPLSQSPYAISDSPPKVYYLVGARMILPFKDRLLMIGPVIQAANGTPIYLQDTVIYSQNGTPYYTCSYVNTPTSTIDTPTSASNVFVGSFTLPINQTATAPAWFEDSTGFGGFAASGLDQPIITAAPNQDVLILGFNPTFQSRFVYTGNDILPFNFFTVNSELGSSSTFSTITMDDGVITKGPRGYTMASQVDVKRVDLENPDTVFEVNLTVNGNERFTAHRDFLNEWIYFTYPGDSVPYKFPNTTFFFNYRDNSWGTFYESYTCYGAFRPATGDTWATLTVQTWSAWNDPWNYGETQLLQPLVLGGNQQGFILQRLSSTTSEASSLFIQNVTGNTGLITSPDHTLNQGDYILITGCLGTVGSVLNGKVFSVNNPTSNANNFSLNPLPNTTGLTYLGGGLITRYYVPLIQTKQFPMAWDLGRKTRIGPSQFLLTATAVSQITLNMYLSQDGDNSWNAGSIVPEAFPFPENDSLIFSQILYTCPESTNLGLTPANITPQNTNLQQLTLLSSAAPYTAINNQAQIWHRMNTSLIGDTVQLGFTLSDSQMRDPLLINQTAEIELHGFVLEVNPSQMLS